MKNPKRYGFPMCECDATDEFHMEEMGMAELNDGGFVLWEDYASLKAKVELLNKVSEEVELAFNALDNGLIETPHWVKQQKMREAVNHLRMASKDNN